MLPPQRTGAPQTPGLAQAAALVFTAGILYFFGSAVLFVLVGPWTLFVAEWALLLVPVLVFVAVGGYAPRATLSLGRPPPGSLGAGVALILGGLPLIALVAWLQSFVLPDPADFVERMQELMAVDSPARLVWLLVTVALTPAVCEEVLFRGVLLSGSASLAPGRRLVLNGLVFGAFHLSTETVVRFLPTAFLGILIAWAVWRTGSIAVGVLMHFVNNAVVVLVVAFPTGAPEDPGAPPAPWLVVAAAIVFGWGVLRMRASTPPVPIDLHTPNPSLP